ncbi:PPC domain-containing protein [Zavarzinella formosa]|uniref:PPC domain-containing protein n=1 Tax=Zavarzinella formosa TaxID=360055 RepID=UPI0002EA5571|nr:PPC domain-containing protein [Zavarzinella formosa]
MRILTGCLSALLIFASFAGAASPTLNIIQPRGVQRGIDSVVTLNGNNLSDAQEVIFYSPGFTVTKLEPVNNAQFKAHVKLAPDTRLGEHAVRVRTATGITEMRTLWVGALPIVDEKEPNNDFAAPQKVGLNVTVHGVADNEDVDYYSVEAKKGQRISVEIEGMRLATTFFDPYIAILDSKRFELATSDDTALFKQDGCLSIVAPEDGTYVVQVRETSYGGNGACQYRLHIGNFPRPTAIVPAGGKLGEEVEVRFLGDASGEIRQKIKLPATMPADGRFGLYCQDAGGISPSAIPFRLTDSFANVVEVEPNDTVDVGTKGVLPCAFNGVIEKPGDVDFFRFAAKKGQAFEVHCYARRIGSQLDSVMSMGLVGQGAMVANDDNGGPDSMFRVTIPQDGEYWINVTDHLKKGAPTYFYRIELQPIVATVKLAVPSFVQYSQERQAYPVPRGNRFATLVSAGRQDFGGDLNITTNGLPAKVGAVTDVMPGSMSVTPMVFEAAPDAPLATGRITYTGTHVDPNVKLQNIFEQRAEFVISNPGQSVYTFRTEAEVMMAVTEAVPFKINIVEPKVPLVHNGTMQLKIVAERAAGFKAAITCVPLYNPPGVGSASSVVIPEGQNEAFLTMNANGGAPVRKWKYAVLGTAAVGTGPVWVSSQLATIEIAPPYMAFTMERAAVEQGKDTQMFLKIANTKPFVGEATVKLIGMPTKTTYPDLKITKDTKELSFPVKVEATAPAGIHRNIFCQVIVTENGEQVPHNLGSTELRIDVPLPPKKDAPVVAKPATPAPMPMPNPMAAPPKRLTRLEQLRLEQEEREKAAKAGTPAPKVEPKKN